GNVVSASALAANVPTDIVMAAATTNVRARLLIVRMAPPSARSETRIPQAPMAAVTITPYSRCASAARSATSWKRSCYKLRLRHVARELRLRRNARNSVLAIAVLHLPDDHRDGARVHVCLSHEHGGSLDVIAVDSIEEVFNASNCGELLQHECAFEIL